ncbi:G2-specific serine/threonine protein kinase [Orbilia brochopaga]|uniref:G2-specific serine/threonine protein kinase n=1 Tax=Orbilia brochopaga TaxID=3140254 RepID=A0AAV9U042_9PEZI
MPYRDSLRHSTAFDGPGDGIIEMPDVELIGQAPDPYDTFKDSGLQSHPYRPVKPEHSRPHDSAGSTNSVAGDRYPDATSPESDTYRTTPSLYEYLQVNRPSAADHGAVREDQQPPQHHCEQCRVSYELPVGFSGNCKIIKKLRAGIYGATAKLEVTNLAELTPWNLRFRRGDIFVAKRICMAPDASGIELSFTREVLALKMLVGRPNILQLFGYLSWTNEDPWGHIFTEYCEMGDVASLCSEYRGNHEFVPEGFLYQFMLDMSRTLAYLHSGTSDPRINVPSNWMPIIHNDIKPDNVLMKPQRRGTPNIYPTFVLGDFGQTSKMNEPAAIGAILFMSPARTAFSGTVSCPADDIFSLGTSLYALANNDFPFRRTKPGNSLDFTWRQRPRSPYGRWLHKLSQRCTSRLARRRPSARELMRRVQNEIAQNGYGEAGSPQSRWRIDWIDEETVERWHDGQDRRPW